MDIIKPYCEKVTMPNERFRIKSFVTLDFEHAIDVHPHWHTEIEVLYFAAGHATQQVNEHIFTAKPGDLIIISRNQLHSTYSYQGNKCEILVIMFDSSDLLDYYSLQVNEGSIEIFDNKLQFENPIRTGDGQGNQLKEIMLEIHKELGKKEKGYQPIVKSLLFKMAGILIRSGLYKIENNDIKNIQFVKQVLENTFKLIDENYSEEISLKKAATASNLSVPHFCRLFKRAAGRTFNEYLSFHRINSAEKMLNSNKTLTTIAMECGFSSVSSFIRNFKKYKNCTPSEYKR